jgi:hypothetical protein
MDSLCPLVVCRYSAAAMAAAAQAGTIGEETQVTFEDNQTGKNNTLHGIGHAVHSGD